MPRTAIEVKAMPGSRGATARFTRREVIEIGYSTMLGTGLAALAAGRARAVEQVGRPVQRRRRGPSRCCSCFCSAGRAISTRSIPSPTLRPSFAANSARSTRRSAACRFASTCPKSRGAWTAWSLVRSMTCNPSFGDHRHGRAWPAGRHRRTAAGRGLAASRRDWPCWCAGVEYTRRGRDGLPASVVLPGEVIDPGTGLYPGQNAGLLGAKFDPFHIRDNPADPKYHVDDSLRLPAGMTIERLASKRTLLAELNRQQVSLGGGARSRALRKLPARSLRRVDQRPAGAGAGDRRRAGGGARSLRAAHVRPDDADGPAADRGGRADRAGQRQLSGPVGHALQQLRRPARSACRISTAACRR